MKNGLGIFTAFHFSEDSIFVVSSQFLTMDYNAILNELNNASLFELYRLNVAIGRQLDDRNRLNLIKNQLKIGQLINYFDEKENRLIEATVVELKITKLIVKNQHDGVLWNIPYYCLNIDDSNTDIQNTSSQKIDRNNLKVGDDVCFKDKKGNELFGQVTKLNSKTAGILVGQAKWRVAYTLLSPVINVHSNNNPQTGIIDVKSITVQEL